MTGFGVEITRKRGSTGRSPVGRIGVGPLFSTEVDKGVGSQSGASPILGPSLAPNAARSG
jgi:hypothetical protein